MEFRVETRQGGAVELWTIDGEDKRNAISRAMRAELESLVTGAEGRRALRCVVLTGAGDRAFCAGADLKERSGMPEAEVRQFLLELRRTLRAMETSPRVFVAAMNGSAFGGGLEIALACDLRVLDDAAEIGLTETRLAIIPGGGGTQRLYRIAGEGVARDLVLTGRRVAAPEAHRLGIVSRLAPPGTAREVALQLAAQIAEGGPLALAAAKQAIDQGRHLPLDEALEVEFQAYERTLATMDRLEGLAAFREKRRPIYRGE